MKTIIFSKTGVKKVEPVTLDPAVFDRTVNSELLSMAYRAYLAAGRVTAPAVKNRGDVSGGGKKPWKQKGTGRARVGSSRVPNWRSGGVVFGPTGQENHSIRISDSTKRAAVAQALSAHAAAKTLVVLEDFTSADGRVKPTLELLAKLGIEGTVLLVVVEKSDLIDRATRNLAGLITIQARYLNVFDIMNADKVIMTQKSLDELKVWLSAKRRTTNVEQPIAKLASQKSPSQPASPKSAPRSSKPRTGNPQTKVTP